MADSAMNDADAQNQTPVSPQPAQGANDTPMEEGTGSAEDFPSLEQAHALVTQAIYHDTLPEEATDEENVEKARRLLNFLNYIVRNYTDIESCNNLPPDLAPSFRSVFFELHKKLAAARRDGVVGETEVVATPRKWRTSNAVDESQIPADAEDAELDADAEDEDPSEPEDPVDDTNARKSRRNILDYIGIHPDDDPNVIREQEETAKKLLTPAKKTITERSTDLIKLNKKGNAWVFGPGEKGLSIHDVFTEVVTTVNVGLPVNKQITDSVLASAYNMFQNWLADEGLKTLRSYLKWRRDEDVDADMDMTDKQRDNMNKAEPENPNVSLVVYAMNSIDKIENEHKALATVMAVQYCFLGEKHAQCQQNLENGGGSQNEKQGLAMVRKYRGVTRGRGTGDASPVYDLITQWRHPKVVPSQSEDSEWHVRRKAIIEKCRTAKKLYDLQYNFTPGIFAFAGKDWSALKKLVRGLALESLGRINRSVAAKGGRPLRQAMERAQENVVDNIVADKPIPKLNMENAKVWKHRGNSSILFLLSTPQQASDEGIPQFAADKVVNVSGDTDESDDEPGENDHIYDTPSKGRGSAATPHIAME